MALPVSRLTDITSGPCADPTSWPTPVCTGSGDSFTNGLPQARVTDMAVPHGISVHPPVIVVGASTYFVNGLPQARVTSLSACASIMLTGSGDHFCP